MASEKKNEIVKTFLFLGFRTDYTASTSRVVFVEVTDDQVKTGAYPDAKEIQFEPSKSFRSCIAGNVYRAPIVVDGESMSMITSRLDFAGFWKDEAKRVEIVALSDSARTSFDAKSSRVKEEKRDVLRDALEPVRRAYFKAIGRQRAVLLARIVAIITGGVSP